MTKEPYSSNEQAVFIFITVFGFIGLYVLAHAFPSIGQYFALALVLMAGFAIVVHVVYGVIYLLKGIGELCQRFLR